MLFGRGNHKLALIPASQSTANGVTAIVLFLINVVGANPTLPGHRHHSAREVTEWLLPRAIAVTSGLARRRICVDAVEKTPNPFRGTEGLSDAACDTGARCRIPVGECMSQTVPSIVAVACTRDEGRVCDREAVGDYSREIHERAKGYIHNSTVTRS